MAVNPSALGPKPQFELADGAPAVGNKLFFYVAGSVNTKQNTYADSTGSVANTNPIVLNSLGMPTTQIWWTAGLAYKVVYAPSNDTDPPTSPIWTIDNLLGINDATLTQATEWVAGPTPTFLSATSFSLVGDQTQTFQPGRRLRSINSGGTVYSTILTSVFGAVTTVTVANDSGALDSGISAVSYGLISASNPSISSDMIYRKGTAVASAATTNIWGIAGDFVHVTGSTGPITSFGTAPYVGDMRTVIFDSTPIITHNATTLQLPGGANIIAAAGDRATIRADTTANMVVIQYTRAAYAPSTSKQPTRQIFLTGSGTYNTPALATRIIVRLIGGGGGGGAQITNNGAAGGNTTFSTMTGSGGGGGIAAGGSAGNNGGATSGGDFGFPGGSGSNSGSSGATSFVGGVGGNGFFGGAGGGGSNAQNGTAAATNTGAGGGGAGGNANAGGGGGGAGGYSDKLFVAPAASYAYSVGAGGAGGAAGTQAGGAGAAGIVVVDEYYN